MHIKTKSIDSADYIMEPNYSKNQLIANSLLKQGEDLTS